MLGPTTALGLVALCGGLAALAVFWAAGGRAWRWAPIPWLVGLGFVFGVAAISAWVGVLTGTLVIIDSGPAGALFALWFAAWPTLLAGLRPGRSLWRGLAVGLTISLLSFAALYVLWLAAIVGSGPN